MAEVTGVFVIGNERALGAVQASREVGFGVVERTGPTVDVVTRFGETGIAAVARRREEQQGVCFVQVTRNGVCFCSCCVGCIRFEYIKSLVRSIPSPIGGFIQYPELGFGRHTPRAVPIGSGCIELKRQSIVWAYSVFYTIEICVVIT